MHVVNWKNGMQSSKPGIVYSLDRLLGIAPASGGTGWTDDDAVLETNDEFVANETRVLDLVVTIDTLGCSKVDALGIDCQIEQ